MWDGSLHPVRVRMQSVRDVLRQRTIVMPCSLAKRDAIRAGCAEAKIVPPVDIPIQQDAIRAGYAEAKLILQFNVYNPV